MENVMSDPACESDLKDDKKRTADNVKVKKFRQRKKGLYNAIRTQMEFYFSNANLSKDRFMQNAIKDGPDVKLEVFLSFNKIRAFSEDLKDIADALKFSTVLKVSEDRTTVSRITPFVPKSQEEVDNCTIYVEQLPSIANHDWIKKVFSEYGSVDYVSLPKYPNDTTKIKGYAFVEFDTPESASKAVEAFSSPESRDLLLENPGRLCSILTFDSESPDSVSKNSPESNLNPEKEDPSQDVDGEPKAKKLKVEESNENIPLSDNTGSKEENKKNAISISGIEVNEETETNIKSKKKRSRHPFKEGDLEAQIASLQVLSKKDWKKLRNKYLDMQRKVLKQLKMESRRQKYYERKAAEQEVRECEMEPELETPAETAVANVQTIGLIVKIVLDEPISDAKRFKQQVKCQDGVEYVEAADCNMVAFVRCKDPEAAKSLVERKIWSQAEILTGEEEKEYWRKIEENRIKKREKSTKPKKSGAERARQKKEIKIDPIEKSKQRNPSHVRFSDDDSSNV